MCRKDLVSPAFVDMLTATLSLTHSVTKGMRVPSALRKKTFVSRILISSARFLTDRMYLLDMEAAVSSTSVVKPTTLAWSRLDQETGALLDNIMVTLTLRRVYMHVA